MRRVDKPTTLMCRLSLNLESLNLLEPSGPVQACNGIDFPFTFSSTVQRMKKRDSSLRTFLNVPVNSSVLVPSIYGNYCYKFNPSNAELNPICHLLALLGAHHILHVSRIRVKLLHSNHVVSKLCAAQRHTKLLPLQQTVPL